MELDFKIVLNNIDITKQIKPNIIALEITDNEELELDCLSLLLNNSKELKLEQNAKLELSMGFDDLTSMGSFIVQNIATNDSSVLLKAVFQDLQKGIVKQTRVFEQKSLKDVLATLANSLDLNLKLDPSLQNKQIPYLLQQEQTDLSLLQELGELFFAVASVKNGSLVFGGKDNSNLLAPITIKNSDILNIKQKDSEYKVYSGVKTALWNTKEAKREEIKLGIELTKELIKSKYKQIKVKSYLELSVVGNPVLQAGVTINIEHKDFVGSYRISNVKHSFNKGFYSCLVNAYKI